MFPISRSLIGLLALPWLPACATYERAREPAAMPLPAAMPTQGQVPDRVIAELIDDAELIVLATPVEFQSEHGILTPAFQLGAKETWYDFKLTVTAVAKGKLKHAKHVDYGALPLPWQPPQPFERVGDNEIVVQYPAVTSRNSNWASAPPLVPGEAAVFFFQKCWYCVPITGRAHGRGPYYKANPWVALGWGSKLPPDDWPRVMRLIAERSR